MLLTVVGYPSDGINSVTAKAEELIVHERNRHIIDAVALNGAAKLSIEIDPTANKTTRVL